MSDLSLPEWAYMSKLITKKLVHLLDMIFMASLVPEHTSAINWPQVLFLYDCPHCYFDQEPNVFLLLMRKHMDNWTIS